jgi:hypothetical protein
MEKRFGVYTAMGDCFGSGDTEEEAIANAAINAEADNECAPGEGAEWVAGQLALEYGTGLHVGDNEEDRDE